MVKSRGLVWTMALVVAAAVFLTSPAGAADSGIKIAVVDVQKLYSDAPRVKQYMEELDGYRQSLAKMLEIRSQNLMLEEEQVKELVDLQMKPNQTDKDKARIKELTDAERAKDEELKKLQTTATPTEPQNARRTELTNLQQKSKTVGGQLEKDYNARLDTRRQDLEAKAAADIRDAIAKIAEAQGFTFVLAKDAALYGGADITDKVSDKLDRKVQ